MITYEVIGRRWDEEAKAIVPYVAGTFDRFINADLFRKAYMLWYKQNDVQIVTKKDG